MNGLAIKKNFIKNNFFFGALIIAGLFCLGACASTDARCSFETGVFPAASYGAEDINGSFPEAVYIKTKTQTFNAYHYYIVRDGRIWHKSIDPEQKPRDWTLFKKTGLPHNYLKPSFNKTNRIVEISADADELAALSAEGAFYRYCFDLTIAHASNVWLDRQGWPEAGQLCLDERTAENRAWALGKRNAQVLYYEDAFGNQHHNGAMEIATTYMLLKDGQEIAYADTGLPSDFSRNYIGPERGTFKALSLSASASTMFVINEAGEMYTRMADFDIIGCDPMLFKYTYIPYKSPLAGTNYFSNLNEWALPPEDWRKQPPIPAQGSAAITRHITILQNGQGNAARELRVAGRNENGESGYWTKAVFADAWGFKPAPLHISEGDFLRAAEGAENYGERGTSMDKSYRGYWWAKGAKENDWEYTIPNFNILEGSCDFLISFQDETCALKLHPVEMWTYLKREYSPGRAGPPKLFIVTLEIPENAFAGLSEDFARRVNEKFAKNDRVFFKYLMAASPQFLLMVNHDVKSRDIQESGLFLTDGTLSGYYPEFRPSWSVASEETALRYASPALVFNASAVAPGEQRGELRKKIEANKAIAVELKRRIAEYRRDKLAAARLGMIYLPFHYVARFTPLRFIDVPKIRTVTSYGEEIVLANSIHTNSVSDTSIWICKKILALTELRIKCYEETEQQFLGGSADIAIPAGYSETMTGYWDIAGLPRGIKGNFSTPQGDLPATLRLHAGEKNGELFGWYLSINNNDSFAFFIDPKKSAAAIYSRHGKTPEESRLRINGALYVNPGRTAYLERNIIEDSIKPFKRPGREEIDISIVYDGNVFEIRGSPARQSRTLIFRGQ
ncbi:MAG: hypothetical protein LBU16_08030 [Treponema sp.]|jgi:hypothetical protein|nr:hypothetical protein [Treponema sp.]